MAFTKKVWKDRVAEYISRRSLTFEDSSTKLVTVARAEGTISEEGDAFNATTMNDLEDRIEGAVGKALTIQTLTAGSTTLTFVDSSITTSSTIIPYTDTWGVVPSEVNVVTGTAVLTFDAQPADMDVYIKVESGV